MSKVVRERDIERYLVQQAKALGGEVRKVKWISRRGAPDRIVMVPHTIYTANGISTSLRIPRTIWVELKAPGAEPEPHQLREHVRMREMGQRVEVVDSFARVDEVLS